MRNLLLAVFVLACSFSAIAQNKHPFTFEDMMALKRVEEPVPSPDGKWVLFAAVDVDLKANTKTPHIWVVPLSGNQDNDTHVSQNQGNVGHPVVDQSLSINPVGSGRLFRIRMRTGHDGRGMESGLPLFRPKKTDRKFGSRILTAQPGQLPQSTDSQILPPRRMANCGRRMGKTFCSSQMLIRNAMGHRNQRLSAMRRS